MKNVSVVVKGTTATITIDLSQDHGKSASGKTTVIGTTGGNPQIATLPSGESVYLGVNCYKK